MHTTFVQVMALAAAALAAPAPAPHPEVYGAPAAVALSTGSASTTRPFQSPTARTTSVASKSYVAPVSTKTGTKATALPTVSASANISAGATFIIVNKLGSPVSTSYIANQTPISGPGGAGVLQNNQTAVILVDTNWSGNIAMSKGTPSGDDSLFEATVAPDGIDVDVSYV